MAINVGDALIKLGLDKGDLDKDMAKVTKTVEDASKQWSRRFIAAGAAIVAATAAIGWASIKMAMDAVESENLFTVSMGKMGDAARQWSEDLNKALGLSAYELRENVGVFYNMTTSMGLATQEAYNLSTGMTELAYDMASFYNIDVEEAFLKLRSGITGETEPLKRLGILVDENTTKMYAYKEGIAAQGAELTQQQKVQARYAAILAQTTNAQGDLAATLDSPTNQLRIFKTQIKETSINLGMALLPAFQKFLNIMKPMVDGLASFVKEHGDLAVALLALVGTGGGLLLMIGLMPKLMAAFKAVTGGIALFKIGLVGLRGGMVATQASATAMWSAITLGVSLVITAIIALVSNWDKVTAFFERTWRTIKQLFLGGAIFIIDALQRIIGFIPGLNRKLDEAKEKISGMIEADQIAANAEEAMDALKEFSEASIEAIEEQAAANARATEEQLDAAKQAYDKQRQIIEDYYGAAEEAEENQADLLRENHEKALDAIDDEMDHLKDAHGDKMDLLDDEYRAKLKTLDMELAAELDGLDRQIDAIRSAQDAEDDVRAEKERQDEKARLEAAVANAANDEDRIKAQEKLDEWLENEAIRLRRAERDAQIASLRDQMDAARAAAAAERETLQQQHDREVEQAKLDLERKLEDLETEKVALDDKLTEDLARLQEYKEAALATAKEVYDDTVQRIEDKAVAWAEGLEEERAKHEEIIQAINDQTAQLVDGHVTIVHEDIYITSTVPSEPPPGPGLKGYAAGGPILGPTLLTSLATMRPYAIAGEAGPEAVVPMGRGHGNGDTATIIIEMDGRT
ncbi:MAG: phage tail tape measure protein, partial [Sphaerochaeta sp.]|nr:phage tail tape measure protein [Sphaerochaeta sp.]